MTAPDPQPEARRSLIGRTLRRRWLPILAVSALASAALIAGVIRVFPPVYRASSLLRVDPSITDLYKIGTQGESLDSFLQTQVQLLASPNVLTAAGTDPRAAALPRIQAAGDVVLELRKAIHVAILPGTSLIEVSMTSPSADEAAVLVNAVIGAYLDSSVEWSDGMARGQIKNLENYLVDLKNQSDELERKWRGLVAQGEVGPIARPTGLVNADHRKRVEEKLIDNDLRKIEALSELESLRHRGAGAPPAVQVEMLEARIDLAVVLDRNLRAKLDSAGEEGVSRKRATDEVDVALTRDQLTTLKEMRDTVARRLDQLKFEARGEARVRAVDTAVPPARPIGPAYRPWLIGAIPFAALFAAFFLFAGVEALAGPTATAKAGTPGE